MSGEMMVGIGFFAWVVLGVIFAFVSNRRERDARSKPPPPLAKVTAFRAPWGIRLFMAMLALFIITGFPLIYDAGGLFGPSGPGNRHPFITTEDWSLFGLLEIICIAVGLPLLYLSGPNDFFLDVDRHTYRRVHGWPFRPRVQEGTWEDMVGIFIWDRPVSGVYHVGITWKRNKRDFQHLGMFSRPGEADRFAMEIAATLDLPLVEPPPQCKQSTRVC